MPGREKLTELVMMTLGQIEKGNAGTMDESGLVLTVHDLSIRADGIVIDYNHKIISLAYRQNGSTLDPHTSEAKIQSLSDYQSAAVKKRHGAVNSESRIFAFFFHSWNI